ncbi:MAG: glycosyltransferase family 2 protein [Chitinophagaceae bacterium]|nr:MAG: glycosyltransferase family 2 protein [Chitinophagaceae bacterium]
MPRVNIFIPCYNAECYLQTAVESVLQQTYEDWSILIIDDCSNDRTAVVARNLASKDNRIRLIENEVNLGMLGNWNKGVSLCTSELFVKLDADDYWHPQFLERSVAALDSDPEVGLIFTRYINIDENGNLLPGTDPELPAFANDRAFSCLPLVSAGPDTMLSYPVMRQGLSVMRSVIFQKIGAYRYLETEKTQAATDTEFYFRVGGHYKIHCINQVLYYYRVHAQSISATDKQSKLQDEKIYETKKSIVTYYKDAGLIEKHKARNFLDRIETQYNFRKVAQLKQEGRVGASVTLMAKSLSKNPGLFLSFYLRRLSEKLHL